MNSWFRDRDNGVLSNGIYLVLRAGDKDFVRVNGHWCYRLNRNGRISNGGWGVIPTRIVIYKASIKAYYEQVTSN